MRIVLSTDARRDLQEIGDYIALDSRRAANQFLDLLETRCFGLRERPLRFQIIYPLNPPVRQLIEGRYRIFYSVREDHVLIERVLSSARQIDASAFSR